MSIFTTLCVLTVRPPKIRTTMHHEYRVCDSVDYTNINIVGKQFGMKYVYSRCLRRNVKWLVSWSARLQSCRIDRGPAIEWSVFRSSARSWCNTYIFFQTHTTGYKRRVSVCQRRGKSAEVIVAIKGVPLMKALKYFMSRMSSNVGFLEKPTFSRISSRKRPVVFGYIANRYIENVKVEAVCKYTVES